MWVDLSGAIGREQKGHPVTNMRPALVISGSGFNRKSRTSIILPMTRQEPPFGEPLAVQVAQGSWVKPCQVRMVDNTRVGAVVKGATVTPEQLAVCIADLNDLLEDW